MPSILDPFAGSGTTGHAALSAQCERWWSTSIHPDRRGHAGRPVLPDADRASHTSRDRAQGIGAGFNFETVGRRLNRDAILELEREAIANLIVQTDATGRGRGITRVRRRLRDRRRIRGRRRFVCAGTGATKSVITRDVLVAMFDEAKASGLRRPLRVYGSTCEVGPTDSFRFLQIPDEILAALQMGADADFDPESVEDDVPSLASRSD